MRTLELAAWRQRFSKLTTILEVSVRKAMRLFAPIDLIGVDDKSVPRPLHTCASHLCLEKFKIKLDVIPHHIYMQQFRRQCRTYLCERRLTPYSLICNAMRFLGIGNWALWIYERRPGDRAAMRVVDRHGNLTDAVLLFVET